ncbi:dihydrodipicolinate synthase family protein [Acidaminococcus fermentans]|uniref:dihydrodipicolinate synthase family protein n=1 Tax=Acidaminococcus fermentans TaxID=905 RepID=UPI00266019B0|nr:dihydrodipicolinate synthase family protein [Acidaminococcus fermentans]
MAKVKNFKTIFPAVSVPLNADYTINEPEFRAYLRWIKSFYNKGIEGLVCNGHTGEVTGLTREERKRVTEICAEECGDVMTIISGVNCENTQGAIDMAKDAKEAGADGILLMPPHMWLRFGMNPDAPFEFIKDVADGADIDIIIHLYPAFSKAFYPVETLIKMVKEIPHVKAIKMGTRVTAIYEHDVRELRKACPDVSLITCHDETLCVSWFPGMDGALIGFAGCVPELITKAWDVFKDPAHHTLKEAQDASNAIYPISQAIYGGGQPSGEAHARLKEALVQRGVFTSGLMRKPVLPLDQNQKDWVAKGLKESGLPKVDMKPFEK